MPPGFDLEAELRALLRRLPPATLEPDDEQGLQMLALTSRGAPCVITTEEVTICSPFPPHQSQLGTCGAHFVGLNAFTLGWTLEDTPAEVYTRRNWARLLPESATASVRRD